ncbi:MAG: zinc-dependent metalloprotease family protein [Cyanobacteria bacterium P01_A01_bin.123]
MKTTRALKSIPLAVGLSTTLASCTGVLGGPLVLEIQPIQVCNNSGTTCAGMDLFAAATQKIWAQADIEVVFLSPNKLFASDLLVIDNNPNLLDSEFYQMSFTGGAGAFGRHPDSSRNEGPINLWFVDEIESSLGRAFGLAWVGSNGVLISDDILDFNGGIGRIDTIAHEIGHNLGLRHTTFGAGGANNLMTSGLVRAVPSSTDDIAPDGAALDQLNSSQINEARDSSLLRDNTGSSIISGIIDLLLSPDDDPLLDQGQTAAVTIDQSYGSYRSAPAQPPAKAIPETGFSGWVWAGIAIVGGWGVCCRPRGASPQRSNRPPLD